MCVCYVCSVAKSCPTLWDPRDCCTPGFPVLHYLPEFDQTHVHWVDDAIQPSHPLSPASPPALYLSQHHCLLSWLVTSGSESIGALAPASVLPMTIQGWYPLGLTGLISLLSKVVCKVFSSTKVWKDQFFGTLPSLWFNYHVRTCLLEKQLWLYEPLLEN